MKNNNYKKELEVAQRLAVQAGNAILPIYYGAMEVRTKKDQTPVTNADVLANRIIQDGLQQAFPLDGIISEELEAIEGDRRWYIDPIDGTKGFIEHTDQFAVHIGLAVEEKAVLGVVYKPVAGEMYFAVKGEGAYTRSSFHEQKMSIKTPTLDRLTAAMDKENAVSARYQNLAAKVGIDHTIISGSEGLRVMKVAEGIADMHFNLDPGKCSTWDVCAPFIIAEEAGAYVAYTDGQPVTYFSQQKIGKTFMVANCKTLAGRICEIIERM